MHREPRHGTAVRILAIVAVLVGLFFMHGLSATGAPMQHDGAGTTSMTPMVTVTAPAVTMMIPAGEMAMSPLDNVTTSTVWKAGQVADGDHSMGLLGLCLALLAVVLVILVAARLCCRVRREGMWVSAPVPAQPVRSRAPNLFALGVLRC